MKSNWKRMHLAAAMLLLTAAAATAQTYPTRAVEIVVPWPPGGGSDAVGRAVADAVKEDSDRSFIVVNKPGASGTIGNAYMASTGRDGYKVLLMTPEMLMAPLIGVGKSTIENIRPIAQLTDDAVALTVRADAPWSSIEEFFAAARTAPGKLSVSVAGLGTTPHIGVVAMNNAARIELVSIPYQGNAPAVMGLLSGDVQATTTPYAELSQYVQANKLKILGVMSASRLKSLPDVPTFMERGYPLRYSIWRGIGLSKDASAEAVAYWKKAIPKVAENTAFKKVLASLNMTPAFQEEQSFRDMVDRQLATFKQIAPFIKDK